MSGVAEQFKVLTNALYNVRPGCHSDPVCQSHDCQNEATCIDEWNQRSCQCVLGFRGDRCEENIDDCPGHQCQNEAPCVDGVNEYTCDCVPGYTGLR